MYIFPPCFVIDLISLPYWAKNIHIIPIAIARDKSTVVGQKYQYPYKNFLNSIFSALHRYLMETIKFYLEIDHGICRSP